MLNKLDDILFKIVNLGLLGFLLYGGALYAPESSATVILELIALVILLYFIADVFIRLNNHKIIKT